jgi:uncharacterized membrane protein
MFGALIILSIVSIGSTAIVSILNYYLSKEMSERADKVQSEIKIVH